MRALIRLYPAAWRRRYGDEYAALLEELSPSPGVIVDVLRGALDAHLSPPESITGADMEHAPPVRRDPLRDRVTGLVAALALATPIIFAVSQLLPRGGPEPTGRSGLLAAMDGFFQHPVGEVLILAGPVAAFLACAVAVVGIRVQRFAGEPVATLAVRVRPLHLLAMAVSVALLVLFAVYLIAENLVPGVGEHL